MGFDKSLASLGGQFLLDIIAGKLLVVFDSVKLCAPSPEKFAELDYEIIKDSGDGAASAIFSILSQARCNYVFVVACDMPFINPQHIECMKTHILEKKPRPDALIPVNGAHFEPLYGFYSVSAAPVFSKELSKGRRKILDILGCCNPAYFEEHHSRMIDRNLHMFTNLNYREDFDKALEEIHRPLE